MKKNETYKLSAITFLLLVSTFSFAQNGNVIQFNGVSNYVDLGSNVGNGTRTIEFWFKPLENITPNLAEAKTLIARDGTTNNYDEFNICFSPYTWSGYGGKLRFTCTYTVNQSFSIYSDTSSWDSNKWYHVAAVIHPIEGMLLFINGHKQSSQNTSFTTAIASNNYITTIGCWGDSYNRFYNGMLDELRFSSIERYDTDFTPPCPEFNPDINTIGLYHFDEKSGATANDVSSNAFNGSVYGSIFLAENVCSTTFTENVSFEQIQKVYPNPTTSLIHFNRNDFKTPNLYVEMYDAKLNNIFSRMPLRNDFIDLSHLSSGAYWYIISDDNKTILDKGTIIKE